MRHAIRLTVTALSLALASTGALALGDKKNKSEPAAPAANSATGQTSGQGATRSEKGAQSSGMPTGQGTTTADAAKQRGEQKSGTTNDNMGRTKADETTSSTTKK
jgi:hypothetical protein